MTSSATAGAPFTWTIAIMCYNEAPTLAEAVRRTQDVAARLCDDFELLIVDDGSRDGSSDIARSLAAEHERVRVVHHETNKGIGEVMYSAYANATKNWFSVVPADMEFAPEEFESGVPLAKQGRLVCYSITENPPPARLVISFCQRLLNFVLFGMWLKRTNWIKILPLTAFDPKALICRSTAIETEVMYRLARRGLKPVWLPSANIVRNDRDGGLDAAKLIKQLVWSIWESIKLRVLI